MFGLARKKRAQRHEPQKAPVTLEEFREMFGRLEDVMRDIESISYKLDAARYHIRRNLHLFSPKELECMAGDGLISYKEIPPEKRTEHARFMAGER